MAGDKWESLDPLVRSRLLLAPLFMRKRDLAEIAPALERLAAAGAADKCARWLGTARSGLKDAALAGLWQGWHSHATLYRRATHPPPPLRDEWVRAMAQSVDAYDGRLHTDQLLAGTKLVRQTVAGMQPALDAADPRLFPPLEVRPPGRRRARVAGRSSHAAGSRGIRSLLLTLGAPARHPLNRRCI